MDYHKCDPNTCWCRYGQRASGAACTADGATKCTSCNDGYHMEAANCVYDGSSAFTNKVWCGANSGRINTAAHCQAAAGKQGYAFGGVGTDPKYLTGCIIEFGKAYFIPLTSTGIMGGATNEFLCDKRPGASYFSGGQCGGSGCGSGGGGIITTEQGCKNAAASYGRSFQSAAGTEWFAGCIIHGGKAYFVPLKAGHTCDKKDAHQSGSNQGYLCMN